MKPQAGTRIVWRDRTYEVILITASHATLRTTEGEEVDISIDELSRSAEPCDQPHLNRALALTHEVSVDGKAAIWRAALQRIDAATEAGTTRDAAVDGELSQLSADLGQSVGRRTVYRKFEAYRQAGMAGLLDGRRGHRSSRVDARVVDALNRVLEGRARASTTSKAVVYEQLCRLLRNEHGDSVKIPSKATFYRLVERETRGRFSFGSAKTRESLALQPDRAFGTRTPLRPGEQTQIDSTRLDVMVRIDETTIARPELTILLDVATRSILSAILRPTGTKSVDLVVVLARALVPYSRRPEGARETRQLISTAWAQDQLIEQSQYDRLREQQPFIFPETITTDRGRNFLSRHFAAACEYLGISLITAAPHTPTDKPHIERTFSSISSLFLQHIRGYVGRSVEHRGKDATARSDELLTIAQMQELLEDWIAVEWQNRPHDSLRDPLHPHIMLSPNEMCRAFRHIAPELHIPLTTDDFIALLPTVDRRINRYGVTIDHRIYDSQRLAEYRRRSSGTRKDGRWPIRVDPYNLHVVWFDTGEEFIPLRWSNDVHELPMLGDVWRHARTEYRTRRDLTTAPHPDDSAPLVDAMKTFATTGNARKAAKQKARREAAAADPMHFPVLGKFAPQHDLPSSPDDDSTKLTDDEPWPNSGGFEFTSDQLDEIRWRLED